MITCALDRQLTQHRTYNAITHSPLRPKTNQEIRAIPAAPLRINAKKAMMPIQFNPREEL